MLSSRAFYLEAIYGIPGGTELVSDTVRVRLGNITLYQAVGTQPVREQDGPGRTLFDFEEAKGRLEPGQWLNIPDYWEIPEPHRIRFC